MFCESITYLLDIRRGGSRDEVHARGGEGGSACVWYSVLSVRVNGE